MNPLQQEIERLPRYTADSNWMSRWSKCNTWLLGSQSLPSPHYVAQGQQNTDRRWVITHLAFPMAAPWPNEINQHLTWVPRPGQAAELSRARVPSPSQVDYFFFVGFGVGAILRKQWEISSSFLCALNNFNPRIQTKELDCRVLRLMSVRLSWELCGNC